MDVSLFSYNMWERVVVMVPYELRAHLSVVVVTVGSEEDLGHHFNPCQEHREIWL